MTDNIRRLGTLLTLGLALLALPLTYWQVVRAPSLVARADNPRHAEAARRILWGRILDRNGRPLAWTEAGPGPSRRVYAYPALGPVIGFRSQHHGTGGIEATYDRQLGSERDQLSGAWQSEAAGHLLDAFLNRRPAGADVMLTLDLALQKVADQALGERHGAVVLLDPHDGDILAMASHPSFDPNTLDADWERLKTDPEAPLLNRATQGRYAPGSIFKTVVLAAAIQEGIASPSDIFEDGQEILVVEGFPIRCDNNPRGLNSFDLAHAYAYSCNVTFARLGLELGSLRLKTYAERFGFAEPIPLDIPTAASQLSNFPLLIDRVELASAAFGQGEVLVTPLHMALIAATIANDGRMPQPRLVREVRDTRGTLLERMEPAVWRVPITARTARMVREMMVVATEDGWGQEAQVPGVKVAGKTGTAQVGGGAEPHAWFVGFAPAEAPRVVIAVLVENGGEGALVAAPIARQVLEAALP